MKIALYDYDFNRRPDKMGLSVELMQLASYYESKGHFVDFPAENEDLSYYDKIIIFSNRYSINHKLKQFISNYSSVEFIGSTIDNFNNINNYSDDVKTQKINNKYYTSLMKKRIKDGSLTTERAKKLLEIKWIKNIDSPNKLLTGDKYYITDQYFLSNENFDNIIHTLSVYYKYYKFSYQLIIRNKLELERFNTLIDNKFIGIYGIILIPSLEELQIFYENNKDLIEKCKSRLSLILFFDKDNLYNSDFYLKEFSISLKKMFFFDDKGIKMKKPIIIDNSRTFLEREIINTFLQCPDTGKSFYEIFFAIHKANIDLQQSFLLILNRNPELYYWIKRRFKNGHN